MCQPNAVLMHMLTRSLKENADQEVNVSEKPGICTQTILVET